MLSYCMFVIRPFSNCIIIYTLMVLLIVGVDVDSSV